MAGNEFALFVLVKNPFAKPVWIRQVHVSLPSELAHSSAKKTEAKTHRGKSPKAPEKATEGSKILIGQKLDVLTEQVAELGERLHTEGMADDRIAKLLQGLETELALFRSKQESLDEERVSVHISRGAKIKSLQVHADRPVVHLEEDSDVDYIEVADPWLVLEQRARTRMVELESSLPTNTALQPGNTAVYTVVLNVRRALLFRPSRYRLQFNVNYSFSPRPPIEPSMSPMGEEGLFTNTIAYELSIRASIYSVIAGSAIGGLVGSAARLLQIAQDPSYQILSPPTFITLGMAIILSVMAVIFMARKSEAQSFVSVEGIFSIFRGRAGSYRFLTFF